MDRTSSRSKEYANTILRFEFKLSPAGNNGIGIRTSPCSRVSSLGIEIQILDDCHPDYQGRIQPYQAHGSVYGVMPAKRGFLRHAGEWNSQEINADGSRIKVTLNGTVSTDVDLGTIHETMDHEYHPGLHNPKRPYRPARSWNAT